MKQFGRKQELAEAWKSDTLALRAGKPYEYTSKEGKKVQARDFESVVKLPDGSICQLRITQGKDAPIVKSLSKTDKYEASEVIFVKMSIKEVSHV